MKNPVLPLILLALSCPAASAPPDGLESALVDWAAPQAAIRYQFALTDLDSDGEADAVVHLTDPVSCGNGGCPLLVFHNTGTGYRFVTSSGLVRKPVYVLDEKQAGWHSLAAVVGFGDAAGLVPIRYKAQYQGYRSTPYQRAQIALSADMTKEALIFEEVP